MDGAISRSVSSMTMEQLQELVKTIGQPAFRAKQIFSWIHEKQVCDFSEMTNLPAGMRDELSAGYTLDCLTVEQMQRSADGTRKFLLGLHDGNCVEAVLMQYHHGNSLCISSQVGCRMGCRFCASTQGGLVRHLSAGEMTAEVYAVMRHTGERVGSIVLMGIGEPLDNLEQVLGFIRLISSQDGLNLSQRSISVSTSGIVPAIQELARHRLGITLSVSLHAADDETRSGMMPVNKKWPIAELLAACRAYQETTGRRISFEYAMVRGVNDKPQDAKRLAVLLKGMGAHVNLIPVNPVDGSPYGPSDRANTVAFCERLGALGLNATIRRRLGDDISAACGQLRRQAAGGVHG